MSLLILIEISMFIHKGIKKKNEIQSEENETSQPRDPMQQLSKELDQLVITLYKVVNIWSFFHTVHILFI